MGIPSPLLFNQQARNNKNPQVSNEWHHGNNIAFIIFFLYFFLCFSPRRMYFYLHCDRLISSRRIEKRKEKKECCCVLFYAMYVCIFLLSLQQSEDALSLYCRRWCFTKPSRYIIHQKKKISSALFLTLSSRNNIPIHTHFQPFLSLPLLLIFCSAHFFKEYRNLDRTLVTRVSLLRRGKCCRNDPQMDDS